METPESHSPWWGADAAGIWDWCAALTLNSCSCCLSHVKLVHPRTIACLADFQTGDQHLSYAANVTGMLQKWHPPDEGSKRERSSEVRWWSLLKPIAGMCQRGHRVIPRPPVRPEKAHAAAVHESDQSFCRVTDGRCEQLVKVGQRWIINILKTAQEMLDFTVRWMKHVVIFEHLAHSSSWVCQLLVSDRCDVSTKPYHRPRRQTVALHLCSVIAIYLTKSLQYWFWRVIHKSGWPLCRLLCGNSASALHRWHQWCRLMWCHKCIFSSFFTSTQTTVTAIAVVVCYQVDPTRHLLQAILRQHRVRSINQSRWWWRWGMWQ
jgi:hypothetical protein